MINIEELKEQLLQGTFYHYESSLLVNGKIYNVVSYDDGELEVFFNSGIVGVYKDKLTKIRRPPMILSMFKWCYLLKDEDNLNIGYIGLKEDKSNEQR